MKVYLSGLLSLALVLGAFSASPALAAKPAPAEQDTVELFAAMKSGDIEVKLILKDSTTGTVTIANKTKKPLAIKLPEAFAGVPVLAQFGGGGMGGGMMGGGGMQGGGMGGQQGIGGGMGGGMMGGGGGMMGGGGGMFNVPAEKAGKLKVTIVCLEHGKKDPNTRVAYEMKPIEALTKDPEVIEVVKMVGRGEIRQHAGQAAAWHLANGLTWRQLAAKIGVKHLNGSTEPYFTRSDLELALRVTTESTRRAEQRTSESSSEIVSSASSSAAAGQ